jgi:hypothetical protein
MKRIYIFLILFVLTVNGWSQETYHHQFSNTPETSRFQIVQSEFGVRFTFNIDKYTGSVFQLVKSESGLTWQIIEAEVQDFDEKKPNQVNYQIFTSGLGIRYTFLINVNTGITWQLTEDSESGDLFWSTLK